MDFSEVLQLRHLHREAWRDKPEWYWLFGLLEEVFELAASLIGLHKGPPEWELKQIASICLNWLEYRQAANPPNPSLHATGQSAPEQLTPKIGLLGAEAKNKMDELTYQCPNCSSKNCERIHQDVFAQVDVIACWDCDEEFTVDEDTDIVTT